MSNRFDEAGHPSSQFLGGDEDKISMEGLVAEGENQKDKAQ
jgi:hypothetical protein